MVAAGIAPGMCVIRFLPKLLCVQLGHWRNAGTWRRHSTGTRQLGQEHETTVCIPPILFFSGPLAIKSGCRNEDIQNGMRDGGQTKGLSAAALCRLHVAGQSRIMSSSSLQRWALMLLFHSNHAQAGTSPQGQ